MFDVFSSAQRDDPQGGPDPDRAKDTEALLRRAVRHGDGRHAVFVHTAVAGVIATDRLGRWHFPMAASGYLSCRRGSSALDRPVVGRGGGRLRRQGPVAAGGRGLFPTRPHTSHGTLPLGASPLLLVGSRMITWIFLKREGF